MCALANQYDLDECGECYSKERDEVRRGISPDAPLVHCLLLFLMFPSVQTKDHLKAPLSVTAR